MYNFSLYIFIIYNVPRDTIYADGHDIYAYNAPAQRFVVTIYRIRSLRVKTLFFLFRRRLTNAPIHCYFGVCEKNSFSIRIKTYSHLALRAYNRQQPFQWHNINMHVYRVIMFSTTSSFVRQSFSHRIHCKTSDDHYDNIYDVCIYANDLSTTLHE